MLAKLFILILLVLLICVANDITNLRSVPRKKNYGLKIDNNQSPELLTQLQLIMRKLTR